MTPILQLLGVSKRFDGHPALSEAAFAVKAGEVHGLLGENGAGKSTLMTVAAGLYAPDSGRILLEGQPVTIDSPARARQLGIGMVHQHFKLVPRFTVAENIALACPEIAAADLAARLTETAATLGFTLDPGAVIADLSIAERQRVEIAKTLVAGARLLILDEPTAVLTDREAEQLLTAIRALARGGTAVVLISHKLNEVARHADRVTVMRAGRTVVDGAEATAMTGATLARLMVGDAPPADAWRGGTADRPVLALNDVGLTDPAGLPLLEGVQMQVHAGEIFALAGVGGNGQTELMDVLAGHRPVGTGQIVLDGRRIDGLSTGRRRKLGLRIVPADRYGRALAGDLRVFENFALTGLDDPRFGWPGWVRRGRMRAAAKQAMAANDVRGGGVETPTRLLSGGNAQKLLLAREMGAGAQAILAHSPSRGLDVRATAAVHERLRAARDAGAAVLVISEDLDEVMALADRVGVLTRGRLVDVFQPSDDPAARFPRAAIGERMLGHA